VADQGEVAESGDRAHNQLPLTAFRHYSVILAMSIRPAARRATACSLTATELPA
jgi:hypothetical protein